MADEKEKLAGWVLPPQMIQLQKKLKDKYQKETVQLPGSKPKSNDYESEEVLLDDVFVKLNILSKSQLDTIAGHEAAQGSVSEMERMAHAFSRGAGRMKPIQLGQILRLASKRRRRLLKKLGVRVLALAGAGVGKTTSFLKKGALEWANGNIWRNIDLLFALPLRQPSVHLAKNLAELLDLEDHGFHRQSDREEICDYISKNLHRVCFILDGLDEIHLTQCSHFVLKIVQGVSLDGVRLIVTSRPSVPVLQLAKKHPFNERIEVLGFSHEDVSQYVGKVLRSGDAEEVMKQVHANPTLAGLMQIPLNAANTCMLYRSGVKTLPTSMPSIVTAVIHQVIKQNEEKKVEAMDSDEDVSKLDPMLLDPVKELAAFAFRTLVDKVLVFEKRHFQEHQLSKEALSLGLLVACDYNSPDSPPQFVFYHLSMHEGLAARHVASFLTCAEDVTWLIDTLGGLAGHLNTFWRFLASELDCASVDAMIGALLTIPTHPSSQSLVVEEESSSDNHTSTGFTHFLSASHAEICKLADRLSSYIDITSAEKLAERLLEGVVAGSGTTAVKAAMQQGRPLTGMEFLRELLFFWKGRVPRASKHMLYCAVAQFDKALAAKCFPDLDRQKAGSCDSQSRQFIDHKAEDGYQLLLLSCHCYREFCTSSCNYPKVEAFQSALIRFGGLRFCSVNLTPADCQAIGLVLQHYSAVIITFNLDSCFCGDTGYAYLEEGLSVCQNLEVLDLSLNKLTDQHADHIAMVIKNNAGTLRLVYTSLNKFSSTGNSAVHCYTHMCQQLETFGVGGSYCTDSALNITTLCSILAECRQVSSLSLMEFALDVEGLVQLFTVLSGRRCQCLGLDRIGLTEQYAPVINLLLQDHRDHLEGFSIQGNHLSLEFLFGVYDALRQLSYLERLFVYNAELSSVSLSLLASLLPYWPCFRLLQLSNNDLTSTDDACEFFVDAVHSCTELRQLILPDRGFVNASLAEALDTLTSDKLDVRFENSSYWLEHDDGDDSDTDGEITLTDGESIGEESGDELVVADST